MEIAATKTAFPKYAAYKDSGVEWLGEIPEGWEIRRFKYLFKEINERSDDGSEELLSVSQYTGVTKKSDKVEDGGMLTNASILDGYKKVYKNDLVSNIMLAWNGSLGFSPFDGITSPAYSIYRLNKGNSERFFHYLVRSQIYKSEFKRNSSGVIESRLRLYTDDFFSIWSILPLPSEQTAIAAFLDYKTAKIDRVIAQKQQMIALLKERKQIIIQNAVTGQLKMDNGQWIMRPKSEMKHSGVEWIGEIPEGWEVPKMKHICHFILDGTHGSFPRVDEGYRLLSVRNIVNGKFQFREDDSMISERHFREISSKFLIQEDDIQLAIVGATMGKVAIVEKLLEPIVTQRSLSTIRVNRKKCSVKYLSYFLQSELFQSFLWNNTGFSAQPGIYLGTIQNVHIPIPSLNEQTAIVAHIETQSAKIDQTISLQQTQIKKLREYKATLIDSAVTGKIKVPGV